MVLILVYRLLGGCCLICVTFCVLRMDCGFGFGGWYCVCCFVVCGFV